MRANELLSPPIQHTFATKDVADFDDAISGADDEVELRLLNAMVPVPKMRRTRERRPDADDDVARGYVGGCRTLTPGGTIPFSR